VSPGWNAVSGHGQPRCSQTPGRPASAGTLTAPGPIDAVAYQPPARPGGPALLAGGSTNGDIYLWRAGDSRPAAYISGQLAPVRALAFSRDGTLLAAGSDGATLAASADDSAIRLWDVADPAAPSARGTLTGLGNPTEVAFEPGLQVLVGAAADGAAVFWDIRPDAVASRICAAQPHVSAAVLLPYLRGITYRPACPGS
jgi:WD40 repeat protein